MDVSFLEPLKLDGGVVGCSKVLNFAVFVKPKVTGI